jgi:hypothetical protein
MRSRNNALEFSTAGSDVLEAGDAVTGKRYGALQFIKDGTITALTASNVNDTSKLLNVGIGAGTVLYGDFSAVTLSGTGTSLVVAHKY